MIAESVVVSGVKPSLFATSLNVKLVSAGICRILNEGKLDSLIEVLKNVKKLGFNVVQLFDDFAIKALRQECRGLLLKCGEVLEIVNLMETLKRFGFSTKELLAPSEILSLCVNKRDPNAAIRYARNSPQASMLLCSIMTEFGKKRDLVSAIAVFEESKQNQGCPNMYVYRTIIDVCGLCGDYLKSRSIYEDLLARNFTPNIFVFNSLMNVNASDLTYTWQIYKQMQELGVAADLASYNILLKSCCLAARVDLAKDIYKEVRKFELTGILKLDVFTYSTMIKALADAKMWQMALQIKEDMILAGVIPNTVTWTSLISACANAGLVEQAIQLFEEMLHAGCDPNSRCCNILLHACVEACQYDRAFRLFKSWKANGIQKAISFDFQCETYNNFLSDTSNGSIRKMSSSRSISENQSCPVTFPFTPTTSTYNILMKACGTDYFRAKALMDEMEVEGLSPNHISWSILIDIFGRAGNVEGALQILKSMRDAGIQPDVITYTTAIKVCVEYKNFVCAFSLFVEMKRYHIKPNLVTYNALLRARDQYGSLQEVQQCLSVYQDMRKAGYKPNDYYLKQLIGEWCEGILETGNRNKGQLASTGGTSLELQNLLLEKVAEHLQDMNAKSLSVDLQGLTKVEARIVVLAALRMIKEKYTSGDSVKDDLMIIFDDEDCQSQHKGRVREAIFKLLRYDLGLEVLSAGMRVKKDTGGGGSENPFALNEVLQSSDLASPLDSPARRPAVLQRLRITKVSLDHWLHKR